MSLRFLSYAQDQKIQRLLKARLEGELRGTSDRMRASLSIWSAELGTIPSKDSSC